VDLLLQCKKMYKRYETACIKPGFLLYKPSVLQICYIYYCNFILIYFIFANSLLPKYRFVSDLSDINSKCHTTIMFLIVD